jgi:hypothetical protein
MKKMGLSPEYLVMNDKELEKRGLTPAEVFEKFNRIALLEVSV